ncbi:hypothetical protein HDV05_000630 [Chytridiales sp. JEL 0842]|nr:hypothetical protein HDV05_000630 [Chytridiales sp. JEL 0842]
MVKDHSNQQWMNMENRLEKGMRAYLEHALAVEGIALGEDVVKNNARTLVGFFVYDEDAALRRASAAGLDPPEIPQWRFPSDELRASDYDSEGSNLFIDVQEEQRHLIMMFPADAANDDDDDDGSDGDGGYKKKTKKKKNFKKKPLSPEAKTIRIPKEPERKKQRKKKKK